MQWCRLQFCDKETQLRYCERQFELVRASALPVFLHSRAAGADMAALLHRHAASLHGGVVHSFDGTPEEARSILQHTELCIGIIRTAAFAQHTLPWRHLLGFYTWQSCAQLTAVPATNWCRCIETVLCILVGINGCSLKTEANLATVASLPADRLMLETDAPWCSIRPSHASSHYVTTQPTEKDKKKYAAGSQVKGALTASGQQATSS